VTVGGALGSALRYLVSSWAASWLGTAFPFGTLAVNLVGSYVICLVMHLGLAAQVISPEARLFLTTGVMGGLTTYSAFDYEAFRFTQQSAYGTAAAYVAATLVGCFAAGALGDLTAKALVRA
jgi:CrcB protein